MFNTSECVDCIYAEIRGDKARMKVWCDRDSKERWYGQYIECENKVKAQNEVEECSGNK